MKLLLDKGADPNATNRRKSTPLFWAIHDEAKVRLLLDSGADANVRNADGRTLVYQAASMGNGLPILRLLLEKGAEPDAKTIIGMTPLMAASGRANVDAMRLLIEKNADVNARNAAGATALMAAAATGMPKQCACCWRREPTRTSGPSATKLRSVTPPRQGMRRRLSCCSIVELM